MKVRFFDFQKWHNRKGVGSTKIRVHNLIKNWPEADLYKYGEKPDVMIYQKVYITENWKFPRYFKGIQILDICDPDWLEGAAVKETIDEMDAVTCPTDALAGFLKQLTDKPVKVIKDRFDLTEFPLPKVHQGKLKTAVWFGYSTNAECLKLAVPALEKRSIALTVISDGDPEAYRWAESEEYRSMYTFHKYNQETAYKLLQEADVCILPKGFRARDTFKSENKTSIARLLGLPVVTDSDGLDAMLEADARNAEKDKWYNKTMNDYDVNKSVEEYKELIQSLTNEQK